jgi:hypothetical protein
VQAKLICSTAVLIGLLVVSASVSEAVGQEVDTPPLPEVSWKTVTPMMLAFREVPNACRKAIQRSLRAHKMYRGSVNGRWNDMVGQALIDYVRATGHMAYGWSSIPGSKGILWHLADPVTDCPTP